nr:hypothetical protein [Tanacetum cinerariifolium]
KGLPITSTRSAKTKEDVFLITEAAKGDMGFLLISIRKEKPMRVAMALVLHY